jgi:uncharacterized membrane protein
VTGRREMPRIEGLLATLLSYGTWAASGIILIGLAMPFFAARTRSNGTDARVIAAGIGLFILLPTIRVILMLVAFVRERDYRFMVLSAAVLAIILCGFALGARMARAG